MIHSAPAMAQTDAPAAGVTIDTVAGGAFPGSLPALNQFLSNLGGIAWDSAGNLVYCDTAHHAIRRIHPGGSVDTVAGNGQTGFSGDGGPAISAMLDRPQIPRYDAAGNLYFWDSQNGRIRRVDVHGTIATVAGDGIPYTAGDDLTGPAGVRSLTTVADMIIDPAGNVYLSESFYRIRRVTPDGQLELFAGTGARTCQGCSDGDGGPATAATFSNPTNLALDGQGNLYIVDSAATTTAPGPSIRRVSPVGTISTFWKATASVSKGGITSYSLPQGLTADPAGHLYAIWALQGPAIVRLNQDGTMTTVAGGASTSSGSSPDGPAMPSAIAPSSLAADVQGNVAFIDGNLGGSVEIREVTPQSTLKTLAGAAPSNAPDGTAARNAWIDGLGSLAFDHNGTLYIADAVACTIRTVDHSGFLSTFAGTGMCAYPSPPDTAKGNLSPVGSLAFDSQNRLWVADYYLNVYRINLDGTLTFYPTRTPVSGTTGQIAIDAKDRVYVLGLNSLYRILADGTTLQPVVLPPESGGTGQPSDLRGLGTDPAGNFYFGSSSAIYRVNDDATFTKLYNSGVVSGFAVDSAGTVWAGNCFVNAAGSGCLGSGPGFSGDGGLAQEAHITGGQSQFAPNGNLYFVANDRVRELIGVESPVAAPTIAAGGIVNALSYAGGAIAPGEIISIFGSNFASSGVNTAVNNTIPQVLGRTKVMIGPVTAPILAMTPNQINVIVPNMDFGVSSISLAVQVDGVLSSAVAVPLAAAAPGLATSDASGTGEGAILNEDGSINSTANPAARGSYISLFGTGSGLSNPMVPAGALVLSTPYPAPLAGVTVTIAGQPAMVQYAGAAPELPNGVLQINALVPANIPPGVAAVTVSVGAIASAQQVSVAVR